jgi:hypothetical protein
MMNAKVRVFALARELGMEARDLVVFARALGLDSVRSQLSTITKEVHDSLVTAVRQGRASGGSLPHPPPTPSLPRIDDHLWRGQG